MWIDGDTIWMGFESAMVICDDVDAVSPAGKPIQAGDVVKLRDAMNGNGYYIGPNHHLESIPLYCLIKVEQ